MLGISVSRLGRSHGDRQGSRKETHKTNTSEHNYNTAADSNTTPQQNQATQIAFNQLEECLRINIVFIFQGRSSSPTGGQMLPSQDAYKPPRALKKVNVHDIRKLYLQLRAEAKVRSVVIYTTFRITVNRLYTTLLVFQVTYVNITSHHNRRHFVPPLSASAGL